MFQISSLSADLPHDDVADWLELNAFLYGSVFLNELESFLDETRESEEEDISESDAAVENVVSQVEQKIITRSNQLKAAYPFILKDNSLILGTKLNFGQYVYLFCLIISHLRTDALLQDNKDLMTNNVRDLFQLCATWGAAGGIVGNAYAFGWPRPDKTGIHAKVCEVYRRIGHGVPVENVPSFASSDKDAGIDIIAWKLHPDNRLNQYMLGQVATGDNWKDKSIIPHIEYFHETWLVKTPSIMASPAIFIPIVPCKDTPYSEFDAHMRACETKFGKMFHRTIIPAYALEAERLHSQGECFVERCDEASKIKEWVQSLLNN